MANSTWAAAGFIFLVAFIAGALNWYFYYEGNAAAGSVGQFRYYGTSPTGGHKMRILSSSNGDDITLEVLENKGDGILMLTTASTKILSSNYVKYYTLNINEATMAPLVEVNEDTGASRTAAWRCTHFSHNANEGGAAEDVEETGWALRLDTSLSTFTSWKVPVLVPDFVDGTTTQVEVEVKLSNGVITDFGGYLKDVFDGNTAAFKSFCGDGIQCNKADQASAVCENPGYESASNTHKFFDPLAMDCADTASIYAAISDWAYTGTTGDRCGRTCSDVSSTGKDTAIKCTYNSEVIIAFAGSNDGTDWIHNFDFTSKSFAGLTVSNGFWSEYNTIYTANSNKVKGWIDGAAAGTVTFTGHSLGGAIANLAAIGSYSKVGKIVTFAEPAAIKSGTHPVSWNLHYRYSMFNYYGCLPNQEDPVVTWPKRIGMQNHGTEIQMVQRKGYSWCFGGPQYVVKTSGQLTATPIFGDLNVISMHKLVNYRDRADTLGLDA